MLPFLSEESELLHREYVAKEKLRYSVFLKSYNISPEVDFHDILKRKLPREDKEEIITLLSDIRSHDLFFSSFGERYSDSKKIRAEYGSVPNFFYSILCDSKKNKYGFLYILKDFGKINYCFSESGKSVFLNRKPILSVDLSEHAYFMDYRFEREEYLKNALSYLKLSKCDL